jgi:hypothetical protein
MDLTKFLMGNNEVKGYIVNISTLKIPFNKVYISQSRLQFHVFHRHSEVDEKYLESILKEPDYVHGRKFVDKDTFYFEKIINADCYIAVVNVGYLGKIPIDKAYLLTCYRVKNGTFEVRNTRRVYDSQRTFIEDQVYSDKSMYNFNWRENE